MRASSILETCIYVEDLEAAEHFYREVMGLECVTKEAGRHLFFRCGQSMFLVFNPAVTTKSGGDIPVPGHGSRGAEHVAFAASEKELEDWRKHLAQHDVAIEREIDWPHGARSVYFRDPAGNSIELATPSLWGL